MSRGVRVLFVCLGNICRSPLAEGVFRDKVRAAGLSSLIEIDSAGTGAWHVGEPPDRRMVATARGHGVDLSAQRARQFVDTDLADYDHILAMDKSNLHDILFLDEGEDFGQRVTLFRQWDPEPGDYEVPDPYYGGPEGFEEVFRIVDRTAENLLNGLVAHYDLTKD
ncbi:MAG: low molecular weight phosphotyrosine protein phosphatase [Bacteroidetes bacterium]|nr:low molecular weight phosphotyrosine protein phosphatase [Bacteroidota bacterium]MDA0874774.1 low molecular weight phosphotyrosine protein phosphatase [Bacteroidota bacterium]